MKKFACIIALFAVVIVPLLADAQCGQRRGILGRFADRRAARMDASAGACGQASASAVTYSAEACGQATYVVPAQVVPGPIIAPAPQPSAEPKKMPEETGAQLPLDAAAALQKQLDDLRRENEQLKARLAKTEQVASRLDGFEKRLDAIMTAKGIK